ncbi:MAG: amino acid ABC transporter permease [Aphanocapsa sp. GSE-SYN-MK-11-07L]|jgi:general L-amino acid transport system permease protein|nr:amino acid ABC transporter permease [Aphanocapsa sp. GSE-SYN-MK-11-07L]
MTSKPPELASTSTVWHWLKRNLFDSWLSSLFTLVCLWVVLYAGWQVLDWLFVKAEWAIVQQNFSRLLVGRYPPQQYWRLWVVLALILGLGGGLTWYGIKAKQKPISVFTLTLYLLPVSFLLVLWLIGGGLGLPIVNNNLWNGLLLTLLLASVSIFLAFPLGVLLALGRKSELPILRGFATAYIEIMRGLPLIGILFMAQVMLPLVLPGEWRLDRLLRAIAGLVLFNAAYLAENVRGGLQSIPKGQVEAAKALGLNVPLTLALVVLPQALRTVTPAIVGQFISLFKDTSLLSLFALLELTGMTRSILAQPQFFGRYAEAYVFIGLLYWIFCFTMSQLSRRLERS